MLGKNAAMVIGEHAVFVELLRRGFDAYLAQGPIQPGWDVVVVRESDRVFVQVKATQKRVVQINFSQDFDFLVIVLINKRGSGVDRVNNLKFYVFSKSEAKSLASNANDQRQDNSRSITIAKAGVKVNDSILQAAANKWSKIANFKP